MDVRLKVEKPSKEKEPAAEINCWENRKTKQDINASFR